MKSYRSISLTIVLSVLVLASCAKDSAPSSSSTAGALTANSSSTEAAPRPFDRQMLAVSGLSSMSEFIRPEIRSRLDEEPTGDSDSSFEPGAMDAAPAAEEPAGENVEARQEENQQHEQPADEDMASRSDTGKFLWAKKSFGDAIKANPGNGGVIVLFADENYYDVTALLSHLEAGRDRISSASEIGSERLQVVFGGYRTTPQVELWVIPPGGAMPEFKTDDRHKLADPEN